LHAVRYAVQGASNTRNRLLDEAVGADYIIFFDDDVIPAPSCIDAYVAAFLRHPDCQAFAGEASWLQHDLQVMGATLLVWFSHTSESHAVAEKC